MTATAAPARQGDAAAPEPVLQGTFALYEEPSGAMVIAYRLGDGREGQRRIPRAIVRAGMRAAAAAGEDIDGLLPEAP